MRVMVEIYFKCLKGFRLGLEMNLCYDTLQAKHIASFRIWHQRSEHESSLRMKMGGGHAKLASCPWDLAGARRLYKRP